nr:vesicle-associated membrane protein-associated protein A-like [Halyomorpha halys]
MNNSKPTQLLVLDPEDTLTFNGSCNETCSADLEVTNPTPYSICYKIKTTATRRYSVKPKSGVLLPYSRQVVNFQVRGDKIDLMDKFKLLSAVVPNNSAADPSHMWEYINEAMTMQSKIKVMFIEKTESDAQLQTTTLKKTTVQTVLIGTFLIVIAFFISFFYHS